MAKERMRVYNKKRLTFSAFIKRYGRIMLGGAILLTMLVLTLLAPLITDYDPNRTDVFSKFIAPGVDPAYPLGTDAWGRDMWTQLVYGARVALFVPIGVQLMTVFLGTIIGLICGYYKTADFIISRIMEVFDSIPVYVMCLLICSVIGSGLFNLMFALSVAGIVGVARLVRGKVLSIRQQEYIECEKVMGASDLRTLVKHVLPACTNTLIVRFSTGLAGTLLSMVGLAFLSVGIPIDIPNWGLEVALGKGYLILMPHLVLIPAIPIFITTFAFCLIGDGMRSLIGSGRS